MLEFNNIQNTGTIEKNIIPSMGSVSFNKNTLIVANAPIDYTELNGTYNVRQSSIVKQNIGINAFDGDNLTKWTSEYRIQPIKDDFYTLTQRTTGSYGSGDIKRNHSFENSINSIETRTGHILSDTNRSSNRYKNEYTKIRYGSAYNENKKPKYNAIENKLDIVNKKIERTRSKKDLEIINDGNYVGDAITTIHNGPTIKGEWLEIELPSLIQLSRYEILPGKIDNTDELTPFPRDFSVLGSSDGNKWDIIGTESNYEPSYTDNKTPIEFVTKSKNQYKFVRLIVSKLNPCGTLFEGLGAVSISKFNLVGRFCKMVNGSCETFEVYNKKTNMHQIEGLTMMDAEATLLADLNDFNAKYARYVNCNNAILNKDNKLGCSNQDKNIETVNDAYNKISEPSSGSISTVTNVPVTSYSTHEEYEKKHSKILDEHNEIMPLRRELSQKMTQLTEPEKSILNDNMRKNETTSYISMLLTVALTSSLFFIFKKI